MTRLESRVGLGIPDCLVALGPLPGAFVMVELKVVARGKKVNLSPHQVAFHAKHASLKCPTFILVHYQPPKTRSVRNGELRLYLNTQVEELVQFGVDVAPLAVWPLSQVDWEALRLTLVENL